MRVDVITRLDFTTANERARNVLSAGDARAWLCVSCDVWFDGEASWCTRGGHALADDIFMVPPVFVLVRISIRSPANDIVTLQIHLDVGAHTSQRLPNRRNVHEVLQV